jgi:protein SCO1/2
MSQQLPQESKATRSLLLGMLVIGVLLVGIVAVMNLRASLNAPPPTATPAQGITIVNPPITPRDFTLPGSTGEPLSLSDMRGKWTLLFFGYTHCPDFCPTTLAEWKQIKDALGEEHGAHMNYLFISVDGERDTPEVLQRYLSRFDSAFVGMSGVGDYADQLAADFGLDYVLHTEEGENYAVDHSTRAYLLDPQGRIVYHFSYGTNRSAIVATLQSRMEPST